MLSDRAFMALRDLDEGARLNSVHSVAREVIAAGLAIDNFGYLQLTELGRKAARVKAVRQHIISDDNIADLSYRLDPMANPDNAAVKILEEERQVTEEWIALPRPAPVDPSAPPLEPPADKYILAMRCAGVATGETGIEVKTEWVMAFLGAWVKACE